jgi:hypothetical protein
MRRPWDVAPWNIKIYSLEYNTRQGLTLTEGEDAL